MEWERGAARGALFGVGVMEIFGSVGMWVPGGRDACGTT